MMMKQTSEMILKPVCCFCAFVKQTFDLICKEFLVISFHVWLPEPTYVINIPQEDVTDAGFTVIEVLKNQRKLQDLSPHR